MKFEVEYGLTSLVNINLEDPCVIVSVAVAIFGKVKLTNLVWIFL